MIHLDTRALREFKKDYPPAQCYVFYGGSVPVYSEDITAIPLREALSNLGRILKNTGSTQEGMGGEIPPEHE